MHLRLRSLHLYGYDAVGSVVGHMLEPTVKLFQTPQPPELIRGLATSRHEEVWE